MGKILDQICEYLSFERSFVNQIRISLNPDTGLEFFVEDQLKYTIAKGPYFDLRSATRLLEKYCINAPTTARNAIRIAASICCPQNRSILLESSPGVGKTSLIQNLAEICGFRLVRLNLSEHIDLSDLLGSDLPAESQASSSVTFEFVFGPVSRAVINDDWLLLDELNLANQAVLEGLNSLLDHRKELYIPEVNRVLKCGKNFKLFAAQNPYSQGGGRKQLPQSFLNRFICIYLQPLM